MFGFLVTAFVRSKFQDAWCAISEFIYLTHIDTYTLDRKRWRLQNTRFENVIYGFVLFYFLYCCG